MTTFSLGMFLCCFAASVCHAADKIVLPLRFFHNIPIATLTIAGKDYPVVLDTGANDAIYLVQQDIVTIPNVRLTGRDVANADLSGAVVRTHELEIADLHVNDMAFGPMEGRTRAPWGLGKDGPGAPPDISVIGMPFFAHKKVLFDLADRRVTVWSGGATDLPNLDGWTALPFEHVREGLIVRMRGKLGQYRLVLDSPSTISLVKRASVAAGEPARGCNITLQPGVPCRAVSLGLPGGPAFWPLVMDLPPDFHPDGVIGREFFDRYDVYIDAEAQVLKVRVHDAH